MKRLTLSLVLGISSILLAGIIITPITEGQPSSYAYRLHLKGFGPVKVGMTVKQASAALGTPLVGDDFEKNTGCTYAYPPGKKDPAPFRLMVEEKVITRIDVNTDKYATPSGAKIGDTEARIKALYPGRIVVEPHKYLDKGHYLIFTPKEKSDQEYRIVFETDGKTVFQMRSGKFPSVEYVEGCS